MTHSNPQIVRGRPLRILAGYVGACAAFILLLFGASIYFRDRFDKRMLATSLAGATVLLILAVLLGVALAIAAAFTVARVDGQHLRFTFCGIPTRTIPLQDIHAYRRVLPGRRSPIVILYGSSHYCPNGLLNPADLANLLRAHGVPEKPLD